MDTGTDREQLQTTFSQKIPEEIRNRHQLMFNLTIVLKVLSSASFSKVLLALLTLSFIHFLSSDQYAKYTFALSLMVFVTQAVASSVNRVYVVGHEALSLKNASVTLLKFQLLCIFAIMLLTWPLNKQDVILYYLTFALVLATSITEFIRTMTQQELNFSRYAVVDIVRSLLFVLGAALMIGFLKYDVQAWQILLIQALAVTGSFIFFAGRFQYFKNNSPVSVVQIMASIYRSNYVYLLGYFILIALFIQISIFMLKIFSDNLSIGTFGSAFRYYVFLMLPVEAINVVILAMIQKISTPEEWKEILSRVGRWVIIYVPLVILAIIISPWMIPLIDLGRYPDAVAVFNLMAISAVIAFLFSPYLNLLMRFEDFRFLFILITAMLATSITLNWMLIPFMGVVGSAAAFLATNSVLNLTAYFRAQRVMKKLQT